MPPEILIAYCSRSGSTAEVAEEIGRVMREAGPEAEVKAMEDVRSIGHEQSLIMGAALYAGRLPKEFHRFVARFEGEIGKTRPWVFVLGPTENDPKYFATAEVQARKELAKHPKLHPADVRIFGGKFDPEHTNLPFPFNLAMKVPGNPMRRMPASDLRDWEWIRAWAKSIADHLNNVAQALLE